MNMLKLLKSKNFITLPDDNTGEDYYSLSVPYEQKTAIKNIFCHKFPYIAEEITNLQNANHVTTFTITLKCTLDFKICLFYYNDSYWELPTNEFMQCITQIA